jgi:hypothetical protein
MLGRRIGWGFGDGANVTGHSLLKPANWLLLGILIMGIAVVLSGLGLLARHCQPIPGVSSCAIVTLAPDSLTADFYDGSRLVAAAVNSANISVTPGQTARISVRNIQDNSADPSETFVYADSFIDALVPAGRSQAYIIAPEKLYQKGVVKLTCNILGRQIGDDVFCDPIIDGTPQPQQQAGTSTIYALDTGTHTVHVQLVGGLAPIWFPAGDDRTLDIAGGETADLTESFTRLTQLTITLNRPGVVGDLYLDGELISDRVASAQVMVKPNTTYQINGMKFADPAADGFYQWKDASITLDVHAERDMSVTLPLEKRDLTGQASVTCQLANFKPTNAVLCVVTLDDGQPLAQGAPGEALQITLKPGIYRVSVKLTGADASKWLVPAPQEASIQTGETTSVIMASNLVPTAPPVPPRQPAAPPLPQVPSAPEGATLSGFGAHAHAIFRQGQALGRDPHRFSKVGDCETDSPYFMIPFDQPLYNLGSYQYLKSTVTYFSGSFGYHSQAGRGSFVAASVLDSTWADPGVCQPGETPLACEYRTHNPAIALIMLRTYPYPWENAQRSQYTENMRTVITTTIQQGIVPVLSTIPLIESSPDELKDMNAIIRQLAAQYDIPLWDFYATTSALPNSGVKDSHLTVPPVGATFFNDVDSLQYGMPQRNLEALEVLHDLINKVMR